MLKQVLYSSVANPDVTQRDVYEIIRASHNYNSKSGITGGLVYLDGYFFQLLEGLPREVDASMQRIQRDWRHHDIVIRREQRVVSPVFADDWMALRCEMHIPSKVFQEHRYEPGMPADQFSADDLFAFLVACFENELHPQMV
ncbi:hypothetical protein DTL42_03405 [Bremerella cremea]|uniref:BLUF domain-containing protein n=1 Tax=Bremerella cremea TaxID=1031537 RepID=A0A368KUZ4_9BACT|nr:BLUF domain-containing protein [Bremerella cremea]RCS54208.1 hypothetical protein DTL42_03405 [Bremerella cremea]